MISGTNLVSGKKSEYTYNGLLARVKKTSGTAASSYMPDYLGGIQNDLVTQISGVGTVNAVYGQVYGRVSQRFMPQAGTETADTYFQHDLYGSTLFAADAQGVIKHHAAHDIWGMPKAVCDDTGIASGLRFTTYDYDSVLGKHFAHARIYDPSQGRMLGLDPVKRGLNGYAYCDNDPANQTDPTGEVANVVIGGIAGAVIGGAFGFAGSALSQMAEGHGFNARKAWGAAANGAIVGAARGALIASGAGIPLAFGVDFAAGMAGSLAEQKITGARIAPVRAAVDGVFNAAGGRLYGTSPLKNTGNAFIRGALEGAVKGGAYNIADVLDNRLRNAYNARTRQKLINRNTWNKKNKSPWNSRNPRPTGSRSPQSRCGRPKPLRGMRNPKQGSSSRDRIHYALPNDRFRFRSFVRDVVAGAVMGGLASVAFYGAGKAVEALRDGKHKWRTDSRISLNDADVHPGDDNFIGPLPEFENHFIRGNGIGPKKRGVLGAHNKKYFYKTLMSTGFPLEDLIVEKPIPHPMIKGIYAQYYRLPAYDGRGTFIGYKDIPNPKTYYDPKIISNRQMLIWVNEAKKNLKISDRLVEGIASNGLEFRGYIENGNITSIFPVVKNPSKN